MLIVIEQLLNKDEVAQMRERLTQSNWLDGADTAGSRSISVKQNLQLPRTDPMAQELGQLILRKAALAG